MAANWGQVLACSLLSKEDDKRKTHEEPPYGCHCDFVACGLQQHLLTCDGPQGRLHLSALRALVIPILQTRTPSIETALKSRHESGAEATGVT